MNDKVTIQKNRIEFDTGPGNLVCEFCGGDIHEEVNTVHLIEDGEQKHYTFHPGGCWHNRSMVIAPEGWGSV